jgi:hypothetical protein
MEITNGLRPIFFEITWRMPAITDLTSNMRMPRLYEKVAVRTRQGDFEGEVMKVGTLDSQREAKVTVLVGPEADGCDLISVDLLTP